MRDEAAMQQKSPLSVIPTTFWPSGSLRWLSIRRKECGEQVTGHGRGLPRSGSRDLRDAERGATGLDLRSEGLGPATPWNSDPIPEQPWHRPRPASPRTRGCGQSLRWRRSRGHQRKRSKEENSLQIARIDESLSGFGSSWTSAGFRVQARLLRQTPRAVLHEVGAALVRELRPAVGQAEVRISKGVPRLEGAAHRRV